MIWDNDNNFFNSWISAFVDEQPAEKTAATISQAGAITMLVIGILGIVLVITAVILFIKMKHRQQRKINEDFQLKPKKARYSIFNFWINYVYFFLIGVGVLMALILIPIGITNLV